MLYGHFHLQDIKLAVEDAKNRITRGDLVVFPGPAEELREICPSVEGILPCSTVVKELRQVSRSHGIGGLVFRGHRSSDFYHGCVFIPTLEETVYIIKALNNLDDEEFLQKFVDSLKDQVKFIRTTQPGLEHLKISICLWEQKRLSTTCLRQRIQKNVCDSGTVLDENRQQLVFQAPPPGRLFLILTLETIEFFDFRKIYAYLTKIICIAESVTRSFSSVMSKRSRHH